MRTIVESDDAVVGRVENLPHAVAAAHTEVTVFVGNHHLHGRGIDHVDAHLLASTALTPRTRLWTRDRRLHTAAADLDLHASLP